MTSLRSKHPDVATLLDDSTVHGLKAACDRRYGCVRRGVWGAILVVMCAMFVTCVALVLVDYFRYDSYLSITNHSRNKLELPAITLCHMSSLRQSVATQLFTEQYLHSNFGREAVYAQFENPLLFLPYWRYLEETQMQKEDLVIWCAWANVPVENCSSLFTNIATSTMPCFTLESQSNDKAESLFVKGFGERFGLILMLDIAADEFVFTYSAQHNFGGGLQLYIHEPGSALSYNDVMVTLAPGMEHYVSLEIERNHRLNPPYSVQECHEKNNNNNDNDKSRDFGSCMDDCTRSLLYTNCSCAEHGLLNCTFLQIFQCYNQDISADFGRECSHCKRNCRTWDYRASVSSNVFPIAATFESIQAYTNLNRSFSEARENTMIVKIFYKSLDFKVVEQRRSFEVTALLGNIGGFIGLTIGASLITLFEMTEIVWICICNRVFKRKKERKVSDVNNEKMDIVDLA